MDLASPLHNIHRRKKRRACNMRGTNEEPFDHPCIRHNENIINPTNEFVGTIAVDFQTPAGGETNVHLV